MANLTPPPIREPLMDDSNQIVRSWQSWFARLFDQVKDQPPTDVTFDYQLVAAGFTYTFASTTGIVLLDSAALLATGTIVLPPKPVNGQTVRFSSVKGITTLTLTPATSQFIKGGVTTIAAAKVVGYIFRAGDSTWYPYQ